MIDALRPAKAQHGRNVIKTLINHFEYPRRGPGMMWEKTTEIIEQKGSRVAFVRPWMRSSGAGTRGVSGVRTSSGKRWTAENFISSMPIRDLIHRLSPAAPAKVCDGGGRSQLPRLPHGRADRAQARIFSPDNWIYVHDPT